MFVSLGYAAGSALPFAVGVDWVGALSVALVEDALVDAKASTGGRGSSFVVMTSDGYCRRRRSMRAVGGDIDAWAPEDLDGVAAVVGDGQLEFFPVVIGSCGSGSRFGDHLQGCEVFAAVERLKVAVGEFPQR